MSVTKFEGIFCGLIAVVIWGSVFTLKEYLLKFLSPMHINLFNVIITTAIYFIIILLKRKSFRVGRAVIRKLLLAGIAGISVTRIACDIGINFIGGVSASVLASLIPVMCIMFDLFFLKKRLDKTVITSISASVIGVMMIIGISGVSSGSLFGYFAVFVSNCAWIFYCYINDGLKAEGVEQYTAMFYQFLGAMVILLPSFFIGNIDLRIVFRADILSGLIFLGIANGVIAYGFFSVAIKTVGVITSNIINNFIPVVTLALNTFFLKTSVSAVQLMGVGLIIFSVIVVSKNREV